MTKRYSLVWGVILIVVGTAFLANQFAPGLFSWFRWPLLLIVPGGFFVLLSLVGRNGGLLIQASSWWVWAASFWFRMPPATGTAGLTSGR